MDEKGADASLDAVAAQAVELAKRLGADQAEAGVSYEEGLSVTVRMGEVESVERQRDRGLAVTVYRAWREMFDRHKRIARWTLPLWVYVSVTGVVVYWMLYQLYR